MDAYWQRHPVRRRQSVTDRASAGWNVHTVCYAHRTSLLDALVPGWETAALYADRSHPPHLGIVADQRGRETVETDPKRMGEAGDAVLRSVDRRWPVFRLSIIRRTKQRSLAA